MYKLSVKKFGMLALFNLFSENMFWWYAIVIMEFLKYTKVELFHKKNQFV